MTDILKRLEAATDETSRRALLLTNLLDSLSVYLRQDIAILSIPHWFDHPIYAKLTDAGLVRSKIPFDELILAAGGLIFRHYSPGRLSVEPEIRDLVLEATLRADSESFVNASSQLSKLFEAHEPREPGSVSESVYHLLAADPDAGSRALLDIGLDWKSEPLFAFDAVSLLIGFAEEQGKRGLLSGTASRFVVLLKLFTTVGHQPAAVEVNTLLGINREGDPERFAAEVALRLGQAQLVLGDLANAEDNLNSACQIFQDTLNDVRGVSEAFRQIGRKRLRESKFLQARELFERALAKCEAAGLMIGASHASKSIGDAEMARGFYGQAELHYQTALERFAHGRSGLGVANAKLCLGQVLLEQRRYDNISCLLDECDEYYSTYNVPLGLANVLRTRADFLSRTGNDDLASQIAQEALKLYVQLGGRTGQANSLLLIGKIDMNRDLLESALTSTQEAFQLYNAISDRFGVADAKKQFSVIQFRLSNIDLAIENIDTSTRLFQDIGSPTQAARTIVLAIQMKCRLGTFNDSPELLAQQFRDSISQLERASLVVEAEEAKHVAAQLFKNL